MPHESHTERGATAPGPALWVRRTSYVDGTYLTQHACGACGAIVPVDLTNLHENWHRGQERPRE